MRALFITLLVATPSLAAPPRIVPASDLLIRQSTPHIDWRWRIAPEAPTAPALLAAMRTAAFADAAKARADAARDALEARKQCFPFRRYENLADWSLAAETLHLLALAGESYSFTGGAHGNTGYAVRIWDKAAKHSIGFDALFSDWPRARKLLEPVFCKALAEEQARRLGAPPTSTINACPSLAEQPIVPFGGLSPVARQFRVLVAPYVAGSYAEGAYLITLAWPEAVKPLVKPGYRVDLFGPER